MLSSGTSLVFTSAAVILVLSGMSLAATTTVSVVAVPPLPPGPPVLLSRLSENRMSTNATTARKTPMSRTNRFERFN